MTSQKDAESGLKKLWFLNTLVAVRLAHGRGADGLSIIEHWMPHGDSPPLHVHDTEDEVFHILEGRMRFHVGGRDVLAGKGDIILAPKGVPHTYLAESPEGVHCLTIMRGGDFEGMVREVSRPAANERLPEAMAPTPEMIATVTERCAAHHIRLVGPPLS